jgi:hypothetical protein
MRFYYDTEFLERGPDFPLALISIGIIRQDGHSLYLVNKDAPWNEIGQHGWLRENVVPSLPLVLTQQAGELIEGVRLPEWKASWEATAPVYDRATIAAAVKDFCIPPEAVKKTAGPTEMWGWYADYDHVILSQLFGTMIDLPKGMPMYTRDLKQEIDLWVEEYPHQRGAVQDIIAKAKTTGVGPEHNALADAHEVKALYEGFARYRGRTPTLSSKR